MSTNLENSAVATGLEKVSFHSNPKEQAANPSVRQVQVSKKREREEFGFKSGKLSNSFQDCRVARQAVIGRCMSTWITKWGSA